MQDSIEDHQSDDMVTEGLHPFSVDFIGSEYRRRHPILLGYELEETMNALTVEGMISHLIQDEKMKFRKTFNSFH
jgi:hypothetical protein